MDKNMTIKVTNRGTHRVGYTLPETNTKRYFAGGETKEITFGELESLYYAPGGTSMIESYLVVKNNEALEALGLAVEPEYFYSKDDIKRLLVSGSMDEFLDCLDFAPNGVLELIKELAVELPLNDMSKRDAILKKLNFNVTNAIEIQNTKYDGETDSNKEDDKAPTGRRVQAPVVEQKPARRASVPQYNVVSRAE